MIPYRDEVILGIVQGLTEFLPVSSSGHLAALEIWLESPLAHDLTFDIFVHFATVLAVVVVFRKDFVFLFKGLSPGGREAREARHLAGLLLIGAVPAGVVGLLAQDPIARVPTLFPHAISLAWLLTAGALLSLKAIKPGRPERALDARAAMWIGCMQIFALLPGVSRSGFTIVAALWWGLGARDAARFSFLCATPLILGATAKTLLELWSRSEGVVVPTGFWVGGIAAALTGYLALLLLLGMLRKGALHWWAGYLLIAAASYSGWLFWNG